MTKTRLEAFSDGVIAIIITIMVLEIKVPHGYSWALLQNLAPVFVSYIISFLVVGIYWGNHHHLFHAVKSINAGIMLSNLNLLFWLSLIPFGTGWMGENEFAPNTIIVYSVILVCCGASYTWLQRCIFKSNTLSPQLIKAFRKQTTKAGVSITADLLAIPLAYVHPFLSGVMFLVQSIIWLIPDRNVERALEQETKYS